MRKRFIYRCSLVLAALMLGVCLGACDKKDGKVVFTTSLAKDELFRIDKASCTMPEYMLYLANTKNKYEAAFGQEVWNISYEGVRFEDNIKENVLAKIAQMKSVYLLAEEKGITLSETEEQLVKAAATKYFNSLSPSEVETLGVTEDDVFKLYRENALADKVYQQIISTVNPEISDDEARTITVEQIFIRTSTQGTDGKVMEYSEGMKAEALKKIQDVREMAMEGEQGFTELAGKYNEEEVIRISFKKGEMDEAVETVAFQLQTDEISQVITTDSGFYLLKCINTFDREETDANKLLLIEKRKKEAFAAEYDLYVNTLARKLNEKLWDKVDLQQTNGVTTDTFFEELDTCLQKF